MSTLLQHIETYILFNFIYLLLCLYTCKYVWRVCKYQIMPLVHMAGTSEVREQQTEEINAPNLLQFCRCCFSKLAFVLCCIVKWRATSAMLTMRSLFIKIFSHTHICCCCFVAVALLLFLMPLLLLLLLGIKRAGRFRLHICMHAYVTVCVNTLKEMQCNSLR